MSGLGQAPRQRPTWFTNPGGIARGLLDPDGHRVPPMHGGPGRWLLAGDDAVQDGMRAVRVGALAEHAEIVTNQPGRQSLLTHEIRYLDRIIVAMVL